MQLKTHLHIADEIHARFEGDINKFFFKIGSVLPDILPNMRFRPHSCKSNDYLYKKINKMHTRHNKMQRMMSVRLGIISHFLSDLCCKPHMANYTGSVVDHRKYEVNLSLFHGKYHEDLMESVIKSSAVIAKVIERKMTAIEAA